MNFQERLKYLIKIKNVNQTKLAIDLGITDATISNYISGSRTPDIYMVCTLADYFNVSTDYLLGRDDNLQIKYPEEIHTLIEFYNRADDIGKGYIKNAVEYAFNIRSTKKRTDNN